MTFGRGATIPGPWNIYIHNIQCAARVPRHRAISRFALIAMKFDRLTSICLARVLLSCHFSVCFDLFVSLACSDLLVCLTARVLIFVSKVIKFSIIFEARAVIFEARTFILEARGARWTISGIVVIFNEKRSFDSLPPRCLKMHILRSREVAVFLSFLVSGFL